MSSGSSWEDGRVGQPREPSHERLRLELYEWHQRALDAEARNAAWDAVTRTRSWRLYRRLVASARTAVPEGTRRARLVRALAAPKARSRGRSRSTPPATAEKSVLFCSDLGGDTVLYRCHHVGESLAVGGLTYDVLHTSAVDFERAPDRYGCFVLHRVRWSQRVSEFIDEARRRDRTVLFDTDDLVFDPGVRPPYTQALQRGTDRETFVESLHRFRATLELCDGAVVSTDPLASRAQAVNPRVGVVYNAVGSALVAAADAARAAGAATRPAGEVTIGYFSGTPSHDADFAQIAGAILRVLDTVPAVRFLAVGYVSLDARFEPFAQRILQIPHQPRARLPQLLASTDVNLAPLEPDSVFAESKSCVKYLEAGLLGVPTIASPRNDFARVIDDDVNGVLVEEEGEWEDALRRLVLSPDLRERLGNAAAADVRRNHTTAARSTAVVETFTRLAPSLAGAARERDAAAS
jgi:glycosyltransferase involved in cell wall biosynthesis